MHLYGLQLPWKKYLLLQIRTIFQSPTQICYLRTFDDEDEIPLT